MYFVSAGERAVVASIMAEDERGRFRLCDADLTFCGPAAAAPDKVWAARHLGSLSKADLAQNDKQASRNIITFDAAAAMILVKVLLPAVPQAHPQVCPAGADAVAGSIFDVEEE